MIIFYPRDLELWQGEFDFTSDLTLTLKMKTNHAVFRNINELVEFCIDHGAELDDPLHPLRVEGPIDHPKYGANTYVVKQAMTYGWLKDDYT